jgi:predicted glycosyltransferase
MKAPSYASWYLNHHVNKYLSAFDCCWVPDNEHSPSLSGDLGRSSKQSLNTKYIGPLSRFDSIVAEASSVKTYKYLGLVSGPESQRTVFEDILRSLFLKTGESSLILAGLPGEKTEEKIDHLTIVNHLDDADFAHAVRHAETIVCRSGYSTIMDLAFLERSALLVPTPGQTEQEYLAKHLSSVDMFVYCEQKNLIDYNLSDASKPSSISVKPIYQQTLDEWLGKNN